MRGIPTCIIAFLAVNLTLISGFCRVEAKTTHPVLETPHPVTVLMFEPENCDACREVSEQLTAIQSQPGNENRLVLNHYVLGTPEADEMFTQNQVTALPEYVVMDTHQSVVLKMNQRIEPELILWQVKEALGQNPRVELPAELADKAAGETSGERLTVWLFKDSESSEPDALETALAYWRLHDPSMTARIVTFDPETPEVQAWMETLGIETTPAYLVVTPAGTLFQKSATSAKAWQLISDIRSYTDRLRTTKAEEVPVNFESTGPPLPAMPPSALPDNTLPGEELTSP